MYRAKKPLLSNLNEHLICNLCKGYFIDATTIIECLHTFCRSCIVKYLENTKYCPVCDVQVHKSKPLLSLRSDKIIQDLVYKLVPRLFKDEVQRRKEFYRKHPESKATTFEESVAASYSTILSPEEELCLTLNYYGSVTKPRYLRCPSAVSIMHLQKLIRAKFDLSDTHHVDILHNQDCLSPCYTLMDIVYIYKLSKIEPLDLTYRIYEYMAKKIKLEDDEIKSHAQTDINSQNSHSNNNNWKEVQLRISENGEMSITDIQDALTSQNFTQDIIEVIEAKPKLPVTTNAYANPVKKKEIPDLKFIGKTNTNPNITILSDTIIKPLDNRLNDSITSLTGKQEICNIVSTVTVPCINASTTTVYSTINSMKCSVGTLENAPKIRNDMEMEIAVETPKETIKTAREVKPTSEKPFDKGVKRKSEQLNNDSLKKQTTSVDKKCDNKTSKAQVTAQKDKASGQKINKETEDTKLQNEDVTNKLDVKIESVVLMSENCTDLKEKPIDDKNQVKTDGKMAVSSKQKTSLSNNTTNQFEDFDATSSGVGNKISQQGSSASRPDTPKPSTKYHGPSQPCYMPKTGVYTPVLNVPKPQSSSKSDVKTSVKTAMKNEVKVVNSVPNSCASSVAPSSVNSSVTNSKPNTSQKTKSNPPMGYKTLRDPPKSWNSQISKANLTKSQPDPKYSDLKNVRPAKFFKMRNNMLRFLGNPASGVKPMYSVHVSPEKEKPQEKIVENREIKKHSIVKIDPKTLKPISEKAPETSSLSSQVTTTSDLKINTSSVSIFNPLKLQSGSPKSDRKSPKSPQSPRTKTVSSASLPVLKRDKPNLNFTPPNPFIPNLSSQTVNPNQFLCNSGPPGFASYDPRVMAAAAYHNLLYGPTMGFPPAPLPYHFGGLDIGQRGKGFDISKIVGMQQQQQASCKSPVSPQGTTKLEPPLIPPQVPYQPRPSPMLLKPPNSTPSSSKRTSKDSMKNEKSLQNTVEKLTMSRSKEIHKASEALNKTHVSTNSCISLEKQMTSNRGGMAANKSKESKEATKSESSSHPNHNRPLEKEGTVKTSHQTSTCKTEENTKLKNTEETTAINITKRENGSTQLEKIKQQNCQTDNDKTTTVTCGKDEKKCTENNITNNSDKVVNEVLETKEECSIRTSNKKLSADNVDNNKLSCSASDDSKENNSNINETTNKAGSEKLETVAGDN